MGGCNASAFPVEQLARIFAVVGPSLRLNVP